MKHLSIILKFLTIMCTFGLFTVGAAIYATGQLDHTAHAYDELIHGDSVASLDIAQANRAFSEINANIANFVLANSVAEQDMYKRDYRKSISKFNSKLIDAENASPSHRNQISKLKKAGDRLVASRCANLIDSIIDPTGSAEAARAAYITRCAPQFRSIRIDAVTLGKELMGIADSHAESLNNAAHGAVAVTFAVILGGLALVLLIGFLAIQIWLVLPLKALKAVMMTLASGDLSVAVKGVDRRDEIGEMARTVQVFKEAGIQKIRLEKDAELTRQQAEVERKIVEEEREAAAKQLAFVVESIALGLEELSAGTLTYRLEQPFASEYERLRTDFNVAMEKLQNTMKIVVDNISVIRSGTSEISTAADDLARRTEQQAATLEETAAALDEITATVRNTAEGAGHARDAVAAAQSDAEHSGAVVAEAVSAMGEIEKSSLKISNIIGVIDEIAFQTNLLALNAGVEAARAGDAGRGFAVVASEVRALAQRSADAAKEIKTLISASSQQVVSGVGLVDATGKALERIVSQIGEINAVVVQIAASAQEQSTALHQVNTAVNQMDQVTQQNAAMVEESTAASHHLVHETEQLANLINKFKIDNAQNNGNHKPTIATGNNIKNISEPLQSNISESGIIFKANKIIRNMASRTRDELQSVES